MKRPTRMPIKPGTHLWVFVSGIVVEDRVDKLAGRHGGLDPAEETMARHALPDHRAVEDIERGERGGRAVPDVIVGHRPGSALFIGRPS
jgi:hypothetical protein